MEIKSSAFENFKEIPSRFTCDGENISPPLSFLDVPVGAKSLVLIMDDPDATRGITFDHWLIWNIPAGETSVMEGEIPRGAAEGMNNFGSVSYGGPCPPAGSGPHRYFFKLYALSIVLTLPAGAKKENLLRAIDGSILARAELIGLYWRK